MILRESSTLRQCVYDPDEIRVIYQLLPFEDQWNCRHSWRYNNIIRFNQIYIKSLKSKCILSKINETNATWLIINLHIMDKKRMAKRIYLYSLAKGWIGNI